MTRIPASLRNKEVQAALAELKTLILARFPDAIFHVYKGDEPCGIYLEATVDVEDTDEVIDTFIDRLVDMQVEERLPVYVVPVQPVERVLELMERRRN
ncbi:MAG: hypothetical protein AB7R89_15470 [Dehalococcoidia bacterium]